MRKIAKIPVIGGIVVFLLRAWIAARYLAVESTRTIRWLFSSREYTNFTYNLEPLNRLQMAWFLSDSLGQSVPEVLRYFDEIDNNVELRDHVKRCVAGSEDAFGTDVDVRLGRRIGWYAIARAVKPRLIIETGVDKGLGACVLASALAKNSAEGAPGRYIGVDINPNAGFLFQKPFDAQGEIVIADSLDYLSNRIHSFEIDLFINDSDHSAEHEAKEYQLIVERLSERAFIIADNAHVTDKLSQFALETNRAFTFFREQPANHWFQGCGIGLAFRRT